jgi:hypothetical protein
LGSVQNATTPLAELLAAGAAPKPPVTLGRSFHSWKHK